MFHLIQSRLGPPLAALDIRAVPSSPTMPTGVPAGPAKAASAAAAPAAAPAPTGDTAIRDKFSSNAPPKPVQQAAMISPITVAKLSCAAATTLPKELIANVVRQVKDTQKQVGSLVPKQSPQAAQQKKGGKKGGGRRGGKGGSKMFDDGSSSEE